jgi:hypothetical protein
MLSGDVYVRQMLMRHHHLALLPDSRIPAWERREAAARRITEQGRGRLRVVILRLRPAHSRS